MRTRAKCESERERDLFLMVMNVARRMVNTCTKTIPTEDSRSSCDHFIRIARHMLTMNAIANRQESKIRGFRKRTG